MNKDQVVKKFKKDRTLAKHGLGGQYDNNTKAIEFYNGDTMSYEDRIQFVDDLGTRKRAVVQFNKVQPNVDAVVGFMAQNRRQAKFIAHVESSEDQQNYSKKMNALYDYHRENENADQIETEQDLDMMICGYGVTDTDLSYIVGNATTNPNGEILKNKIDVGRFYWNPSSRGKNLLDSTFMGYWEEFDLSDALDLFQGSSEEDFEMVGDESEESGYQYNPWGGLYDKIKFEDSVEWANKEQDLVRVFNHQWMEYETFYRAKNPIYTALTPEDALYSQAKLQYIQSQIKNDYQIEGIEYSDMFAFDPAAEELTFDEKTKRIFIEQFGDMIKPVAFKRKCFYTAVISGKHVFKFFKSISQQGFSIKVKTGTFNASRKIWVGMVNAMMEPAEYHNKALTELMFTIAANSKGGVMVEEDAVEDITVFEDKWAQTDGVITVNSGALAAGKIQEKARGQVPTGLENIITLSAQSVAENGVDPAFVGKIPDGTESGILFKRRIRQVISKFARFFDSITLAQKEDARLHADLIPVWLENNAGQSLRITGEDGADQFIQLTKDLFAPEYDVTIQESPQTPEDKQETAMVLNALGDKMAMTNPQGAAAIWAESLSLMSIDGDIVNRIKKVLQPKEDMVPMAQFQELQKQLQQLQSEMTQAQVEKVKSETAKNMATVEKIPVDAAKTHADTVNTLETARRTGYENDILQSGNFEPANVSI